MTEVVVHGMHFQVTALTEQGPRAENQDAFTLDGFAGDGILALADGMGGEKSGRVAADAALATLLRHAPIRTIEQARIAVREADRIVAEMSAADPEAYGGMGCALGVLCFADRGDGPGWIAAHVGDVRILSRSPDGLIRLETRDHTPAFARWEAGEISLDAIPDSAGSNRLQRAVGRGGEPDVSWLPVRPGWSWLILSDGVYKVMRMDELGAAMQATSAEDVVESIRRKVLERGPDDNFTAIYVRATKNANATISPVERTNPMADTSHSQRGSRSATTGFIAALAVVALVLAAIAFLTAREAGGESGADRAEVERLREEVDSLRTIINQLRDPFGPSAPLDAPGATNPPPTQGR